MSYGDSQEHLERSFLRMVRILSDECEGRVQQAKRETENEARQRHQDSSSIGACAAELLGVSPYDIQVSYTYGYQLENIFQSICGRAFDLGREQ